MRRLLRMGLGGLLAGFAGSAWAQADGSGPIQLAPPVTAPAPGVPAVPAAPGVPAGAEGVPAAAVPAPAAPPPWVAGATDEGGAPGCRLRKESGGYVFEVVASAARPGTVTFGIHRDDWALPEAGSAPVGFGFDRGVELDGAGVQDTHGITVAFDATTLPPWMGAFTHDLTMTVTAKDGAFAPVPVSLAGTTEGVTAMQKCVWASHLPSVPPPFTATPPAVAAGAAPVVAAGAAPAVADGAPAAAGPAVAGGGHQSPCLPITDDLQRLACYDREARAAAGQ